MADNNGASSSLAGGSQGRVAAAGVKLMELGAVRLWLGAVIEASTQG